MTSATAMRALYPKDWDGRYGQIDLDFEIIPEPAGPHGEWSLSARACGMTIGYLPDPQPWADPIRRVVASGYRPVTNGHIWAGENPYNENPFDGTPRLNLGEPLNALPLNDPPTRPYTLLPRGSIVQVTKEEDHTNPLLTHVPPHGSGPIILTLHEVSPLRGSAKPYVEVRIDDERIGQLTPQMSQRFLPMIRHFDGRGLTTAVCGDITGSQVAAEVRVESIKANEADEECLNGPPVNIPKLVPRQMDPRQYDLTSMASLLRPLAPPAEPPPPPELQDRSVIRFNSGRYVYVAVRHGPLWETTASGSWGNTFRETMTWAELTKRIRSFEVPTGWDSITNAHDPRAHMHGAVVHFYVNGRSMAAVCVSDRYESWYTTMTQAVEQFSPFYKQPDWEDIVRYGQQHNLVTSWARYP